MEADFFEESLFNYITVNYTHPLKALEAFRKMFPLFIGQRLEKSLKIFS
jgi:hypothetical protein